MSTSVAYLKKRVPAIQNFPLFGPVGVYVVGLYNTARTHRSLDKNAPISHPVQRVGRIVSHALSADCIVNTSESEFSVHTRIGKRQNKAIIAVDVRRFDPIINTDGVLGTHSTHSGLARWRQPNFAANSVGLR